jgi:diguanylate cyclase (GGDEF)-like protein
MAISARFLSSSRHAPAIKFLAGGIVLLSIILALTIYETFAQRERLQRETERNLSLLVTALGEYTERTLQSVDILLHNIEQDIENIDLNTAADRQRATELLRQHNSDFPFLSTINILDKTGALQAYSVTVADPMPSYSDREYFLHAKTENNASKISVGRPIYGRKSQRWAIPLTLTRQDHAKRFNGLIYAGLDIEKLLDYYRSAIPFEGGAAALYRLDARLLARHPLIAEALEKDYSAIDLFRIHRPAKPEGTYRAISSIDKKPRTVAYRTLSNYGLLLNVSADENNIKDAWITSLWLPGIVGGTCLIAIAALVMAMRRQLGSHREMQARLAWQASHDAATSLPNRFLFEDRLHKAIQNAERKSQTLALLFIDLDNFKRINDSLGHAIGDEVLRTTAVWLRTCIRESDTVARFGGDEFAILLPELSAPADAGNIAAKIIQQFNQPMRFAERDIKVTTSIGISIFPQDGSDATHLMASADAAMYRAKESGRNLACLFDQQLSDRIRERMEIEAQLQNALARNEFSLAFQPILCSQSLRVVGAEALLRWHHPELGHVSPDRFIPVAESIGLIDTIGAWTLAEACRQAQSWPIPDAEPLILAVNISPRQISQASLIETIESALAESGLPAARLELEITENLQITPDSQALRNLFRIRELGIRLAVDDFGTGYSSLSYLSRLPVSAVKIDRSFVNHLENRQQELVLTRAIIALARGLGLKTIGEGVETAAQRDILSELGCDRLQGYLFSRPMAAGAFVAWLAEYQAKQPV